MCERDIRLKAYSKLIRGRAALGKEETFRKQ